jgi:hypothetical protein
LALRGVAGYRHGDDQRDGVVPGEIHVKIANLLREFARQIPVFHVLVGERDAVAASHHVAVHTLVHDAVRGAYGEPRRKAQRLGIQLAERPVHIERERNRGAIAGAFDFEPSRVVHDRWTIGPQGISIRDHTWEAGMAFPTAARFFELARTVGVRDDAVLTRFFRSVPPRLKGARLDRPEGVRLLLDELLGRTRITALAQASGLSRFSIGRWLSGKGQPKLPELFTFVEHASLRLLDFVAAIASPDALPTIREEWAALQASRAVGYEHPMTHAVLRALEITEASRHQPGRIAMLVGIDPQEEERCLAMLRDAGQIRWKRGRWVAVAADMVDFRRDPAAAQALKAFWAELAADRSREPRPGFFAYNVFAVSRRDLERLQELQRATLRQMRTIISASEPSEVVALANFQVFDLGS